MKEFWREAAELAASGKAFVSITLVAGRGHIPQDPGAKALVTEQGLAFGTVGGGKVEAKAIRFAQELLRAGSEEPSLQTWNLQRDVGMTCGGELTYLFETQFPPRWEIAVFGAGHVGQAVVRALLPLECRVTCVDPRQEWIARLPPHERLTARLAAEPAAEVERFSLGTYFVVMTQGHGTDLPILRAIERAHPQAPYVGAIGSDGKAARLRKDLRELGVPDPWLEKFRCPIGLRFGGNHPAEIAVSVVAQLLQTRDADPQG